MRFAVPFAITDVADGVAATPYALAVAGDGSLRIGGSFDGGLELAGVEEGTMKMRAVAQLDGFVIARPAP